jgi:PPOX class probable F420-dependent enzyme
MYLMPREQWIQFALTGTRTGKLAVTRLDGTPHVTPTWFLIDSTADGDALVFTTHHTTVKARALRRDPRFSMCVDDQQPPYSYVLMTATATISEDLDDLLRWATRLGERYMGPDAAEPFGRRNAVPGELLVRATITKVIAQADISA